MALKELLLGLSPTPMALFLHPEPREEDLEALFGDSLPAEALWTRATIASGSNYRTAPRGIDTVEPEDPPIAE